MVGADADLPEKVNIKVGAATDVMYLALPDPCSAVSKIIRLTMRKFAFVFALGMLVMLACNSSNNTNSSNAGDSADATIADTALAGMNRTATANDSLAANALPSVMPDIDTSDAPIAALANLTTVKLEKIRGIPDFIQGCSDGSAETEQDFETEKYIFVSDGQSVGMLMINGVRVYLRADLAHSSEDVNNVAYIGHGFRVHIVLSNQQSHEASDSFTYQGTLEVLKDGKSVYKTKIWGGGAC